jgi:hypothetical protein
MLFGSESLQLRPSNPTPHPTYLSFLDDERCEPVNELFRLVKKSGADFGQI